MSTNSLCNFFKVNNSHPMLKLYDWDLQLKNRNQVNVFVLIKSVISDNFLFYTTISYN